MDGSYSRELRMKCAAEMLSTWHHHKVSGTICEFAESTRPLDIYMPEIMELCEWNPKRYPVAEYARVYRILRRWRDARDANREKTSSA